MIETYEENIFHNNFLKLEKENQKLKKPNTDIRRILDKKQSYLIAKEKSNNNLLHLIQFFGIKRSMMKKKTKLLISIASTISLTLAAIIPTMNYTIVKDLSIEKTDINNNYVITFQKTNTFSFGDKNLDVNVDSIDETWIKNKVIEKKDQIFVIDDKNNNFDWNDNVIVWDIVKYSNELTFNVKLNNYTSYKAEASYINETLTFTGFKEQTTPSVTIINDNASNIYTGRDYQLSARLTNGEKDATYEWSVSHQTNITLRNENTSTVTFNTTQANIYTFTVVVKDNSGNKIAQDDIDLTILDGYYQIVIQNNTNNTFAYGDGSKLVSDQSIDENWVKQKVIRNKNNMFSNKNANNLPSAYDWEQNITIKNLSKDENNKSLSFQLNLANSTNNPNIQQNISENVTFTGFEDPNKAPSNVIEFQSQDTFDFGDQNIFASKVKNEYLSQKISENAADVFIIPSNWDSHFDWEKNLRYGSTDYLNDLEGKITIRVTLITPSNTQISKNLTFTGFKKEVPYNITINKETYAFGDPNQLASMVNEEWIKAKVIEKKDNIFKYTTIPDNYDWNSNISIETLSSDDNKRSIIFQLNLKNANNNGDHVTQRIQFNDFKQLPWNTNAMPTDDELLINELKKATTFESFVNERDAYKKLNEYGVVRTFALVNRMLKDVLFQNLGFTDVNIKMTNNNFNELIFTLVGTATNDIANWGNDTNGSIPSSSIIENWSGAQIKKGERVELVMKYVRDTGASNRGKDLFSPEKQISFRGQLWGVKEPNWTKKGIGKISYMFLNEFKTSASIKVNNSIIKQSATSDNRSLFLFVNTYNGMNYLIDKTGIK